MMYSDAPAGWAGLFVCAVAAGGGVCSTATAQNLIQITVGYNNDGFAQSETTAQITDAEGTIVQSFGVGSFPIAIPFGQFDEMLSLDVGEYTFTIFDGFGDGFGGGSGVVVVDDVTTGEQLLLALTPATFSQTSLSFTVVPAPAPTALLGVAGMYAARRRR